MSQKQSLTVVVVTWNGRPLLGSCLQALAAQERRPDEVVVVDNGSTDGTVEWLRALHPEVRIVSLSSNTGFASGVNAGVLASQGDLVALLNNDVIAEPSWLSALEHALQEPTVSFAAPKILDAQGSNIDSAGDYIDRAFTAHQHGHGQTDDGTWDVPRSLIAACAAATLYRRAVLEADGGMPGDFFAYFEDADVCLRAAARGMSGRYVPQAQVRHATSSTSSRVTGFKRYHGTRNAWWLLARNLPLGLMPRVLPRFIFTQLVWLKGAARVGELRPAMRGHRDGLLGLPRAIRSRTVVGSSEAVWSQLSRTQVLSSRRSRGRR